MTITTGLVNGVTVPTLLNLVVGGKISPEKFGRHNFQIDDMLKAYDVFANAGQHNALKVVISR